MSEEPEEQERFSEIDREGAVIQGKYRVDKLLGEGGMGSVYAGEHTLIGRKVAIKFLRPEVASDPSTLERFTREARAATAIGNEHIVEVTDMGTLDDNSTFMVLEYLEGRELGDLIRDEGALPLGRAVRIVTQICDALSAAHGKGIVHRDLKPANVYLIERAGSPDFVKVLDFGVAKVTQLSQGETLTATGAAIGTPAYMAPEQAQGSKQVDTRADIYALGILFYEALTGTRPFSSESFVDLLMKICYEDPPPIEAYRGDLPREVEAVLDKMLAKEREDRYQSCDEVKDALSPFAGVDAAPQLTEDPSAGESRDRPASDIAMAAATAKARHTGVEPVQAEAATVAAGGGKGAGSVPLSGSLSPTEVPSEIREGKPDERRRGWLIPAAVAAVLVVGVAVVVALSVGGGGGGEDSSAAANVLPAAEPEPAAELIRVQIDTEPGGAELRLDGEPIANPFDGEIERLDRPRRIEATLDGYQALNKSLSLSSSQRVRLELTPELVAAEPDAGGQATEDPRPTKSARRARPTKAGTRPATDPTPPTATKTASAPDPAPPAKATPAPDPTPAAPTPAETTATKSGDRSPLKRVTF